MNADKIKASIVSHALSLGRVCRRRHRDALHGRRARVLHQGSERRTEEERHCALFTAGWRESDSVHAIELLFQTLFEVLECSGTGWRPSPDKLRSRSVPGDVKNKLWHAQLELHGGVLVTLLFWRSGSCCAASTHQLPSSMREARGSWVIENRNK